MKSRPSTILEANWVQWGAGAFDFGSWVLLLQGCPDRAANERRQATELVQAHGNPFGRVSVLAHGVIEQVWSWSPSKAQALAREVIAQAVEHGLQFRVAEGQMVLGWALTELGEPEQGLAALDEGYALFRGIGYRIATSLWLLLFAYAYRRVGRIEHARRAVREALEFCTETGEAFLQAELRRVQGELLLVTDRADTTSAESEFLAAIDIAHRQGARLFELRAACSLARLWQTLGRQEQALALLQPIRDAFTEGFEMHDLCEARALILDLRT